MSDLAAGLRDAIEEHRGNRTGTYSGTSNYVPISVLEELLEAQTPDGGRGPDALPSSGDDSEGEAGVTSGLSSSAQGGVAPKGDHPRQRAATPRPPSTTTSTTSS